MGTYSEKLSLGVNVWEFSNMHGKVVLASSASRHKTCKFNTCMRHSQTCPSCSTLKPLWGSWDVFYTERGNKEGPWWPFKKTCLEVFLRLLIMHVLQVLLKIWLKAYCQCVVKCCNHWLAMNTAFIQIKCIIQSSKIYFHAFMLYTSPFYATKKNYYVICILYVSIIFGCSAKKTHNLHLANNFWPTVYGNIGCGSVKPGFYVGLWGWRGSCIKHCLGGSGGMHLKIIREFRSFEIVSEW